MRIIVTGSRTWEANGQVFDALNVAAAESKGSRVHIRHGGNPNGADFLTHLWCQRTPQVGYGIWIVEEVYYPDWKVQEKVAGIWRNRRMIDDGADLCLAFLMPCTQPGCHKTEPHDTHGASHCATYAECAGIPVRRYRA